MWNKLLPEKLTARVTSSERGRRFVKNFSISLGGSGSAMILALLTTALVTRTLSIENFGRLMIVLDLFAFVILFFDVRVQDVLYRYYPEWKQESSRARVRGLLIITLAASAALGLVVGIGAVAAAPWMSETWYDDPALTEIIRIYAVAAVAAAFSGFSTAILRIHDRFSAVVVPQVIGWASTLAFLLAYLLLLGGRDLRLVTIGYAIGAFLRQGIPFLLSLRQARKWLVRRPGETGAWKALAGQRRALGEMFFQTNLTGYLKLGSDRGGAFLLGLLSSPVQVALFSLARQLVSPLTVLQGNIQTSIAPEIFDLRAKEKFGSLERMTLLLTRSQVITAIVLMITATILIRPAILIIFGSEYLPAVPIFLILVGTGLISYVAVAFYPLAVALEELKRRNLMVAFRFVYLGAAAAAGMSALTLALAQLCGSITTRVGADWSLFRRLRRLAAKKSR